MQKKTVLSINWGLSIGGISKYNVLLRGVSSYEPVTLHYACILSDAWHCDESALQELDATIISIRSRVDLSWLPGMADTINTISPDLIITHGFNAHLVAWMMSHMYRIRVPAVMSYHGLYHPTSTLRHIVAPLYNRFTEKYARDNATRVVSVAEISKKYLVSKGVPAAKIDVIHNGIPDLRTGIDARDRVRREWGLDDQHVVLGIASRIDPVKGLEFLVEAMGILSVKFPALRLVLVGTGTLENELKGKAADMGIADKTIFTGFRSDIPDCLAAFDIFMLPSLAEYHSIALLEAMRATKAIVATNVGGNTESVRDGLEAIIVPPGDFAALVEAVEKLLQSTELRMTLAGAARKRFLEHFLGSVMVERYARWLISCTESDNVTK
jgi:glycosyltransferase involved in cell wall biosynthesis